MCTPISPSRLRSTSAASSADRELDSLIASIVAVVSFSRMSGWTSWISWVILNSDIATSFSCPALTPD
jgi:hypothetical protein